MKQDERGANELAVGTPPTIPHCSFLDVSNSEVDPIVWTT